VGTRADFYVGRGPTAEWLGSIAWDGYDIPESIAAETDESAYRAAVRAFLDEREDGTIPERDGWPWPWDTSVLTDYVYALFDGRVWYSCFDSPWHPCPVVPDMDDEEEHAHHEWPLRGGRSQGDIFGPRSGVLLIRAP